MVVVCVVTASEPRPAMYILADIHFDPDYGTENSTSDICNTSSSPPYGMTGCDTPLKLLESALDDFVRESINASENIILYLGDAVRHEMKDFEDSSDSASSRYIEENALIYTITHKMFSTLQAKLNQTSSARFFHHPSIISLLGNEDCVPHYHFLYSTEPSLHPALVQQTKALVDTGVLSAEEGAMYGRCAFYSRVVAKTNLKIIAINTILYSVQLKPKHQSSADPCGQFAWLDSELHAARAAGQRVMITGHIVPFAVRWDPTMRDTYREMMMNHSDVISVQWFAHTHMFAFQTFSKEDDAPPLFDIPAITPRDGNVPSYIWATFEDQTNFNRSQFTNSSWKVNTIHERFYNVATSPNTPVWRNSASVFPTSFKEFHPPISTSSLYKFGVHLLGKPDGSEEWRQFEDFHFGGQTIIPLTKSKKFKLLCDMLTASDTDYRACRGE